VLAKQKSRAKWLEAGDRTPNTSTIQSNGEGSKIAFVG